MRGIQVAQGRFESAVEILWALFLGFHVVTPGHCVAHGAAAWERLSNSIWNKSSQALRGRLLTSVVSEAWERVPMT